jgi:two-component system chemotaxis sensor kinase CheA
MSEMSDDFKEIIDNFLVETNELIEKLSNDFIQLESHADDTEIVHEIFRTVHSIKGTAGFLGFANMQRVAHGMEDILNKLRHEEFELNPMLTDVLYSGLDHLQVIVEDVKSGNPEKSDVEDVVKNLKTLYENPGADVDIHSTFIAEGENVDEIQSEIEEKEIISEESVDEGFDIPDEDVNDGMKEIIESFIIETEEILETLDQDLLELENNPNDPDLLNKIFRSAHTIKGTSSFVEFDSMTNFTHHMEDVLNKLRHNELEVNQIIMDTLLESADVIKELLRRFKEGDKEPLDVSGIVQTLKEIFDGKYSDESGEKPQSPKVVSEKENEKSTPKKKAVTAAPQFRDQTIRVDVERLDSLMNLVGELVASRNRLSQLSIDLSLEIEGNDNVANLGTTVSQIDFVTSELQSAVMKTRMLPVGKVFNKFPRLIRDLAREFGKQIELKISGEETELDKSVIEEIGDPMVHLIRNSADHGIEMPKDRIAKGKTPKGVVRLEARHEGNHIVIIIEDDGAGIAVEKLKKKALEKKLISEEEARMMTDKDAFHLIFAPGFSTAAKVTNISGRGVGMDVVKTNIAKLNGVIEVDSEEGFGTKFTIKLPITLAIIQGLLAKVKHETYIIPLASVSETISVKDSEIRTVNNKEVVKNRDRILPLLRLENIYSVDGQRKESEKNYIVVVGLADQQVGLVVDKLLGQQEVVIKSLGPYLSTVKGVSGSAIMGDGLVRMIVDIAELINLVKTKKEQSELLLNE